MRIIVVGSFKWEMYAPAIYHSLKKMGHEVYAIEYKEPYKKKILFLSFLSRIEERFHIGLRINKANRELINKVKEVLPDLVFIYRGVFVYPSTIKNIKQEGCRVFSYNNDDPFSGIPSCFYWQLYLRSAQYCDINFVYRKKNINDFAKIGIKNTQILMPYYLKENNYPLDIQRDIDIAFVGHFENDGRDYYIKALLDAGLDVTVFGDQYWLKAPLYNEIKGCLRESKRGEEYNKVLNRIKIALVFLSKINQDTYTRRCFEIPATCGLMLCEYTDDMNTMFTEDVEAVYFRTPEELVEKCKKLLANPSLITKIAFNGYKKIILGRHSVDDRVLDILTSMK